MKGRIEREQVRALDPLFYASMHWFPAPFSMIIFTTGRNLETVMECFCIILSTASACLLQDPYYTSSRMVDDGIIDPRYAGCF